MVEAPVRALIPALVAAAMLAACGGRAAAPDTIALYVSIDSVQCEGGGTAPAEWERRLAAAGVRPVSTGCGVDGMMRPAVCGAPDGRIFIVDVPAAQAPAAAALGLARLNKLPDAARTPCR